MQLSLLTHFYNEEILLPHWINHHKKIFDRAILVNQHSTDNSVAICKELMPPGWVMVDSYLNDFNAGQTDDEMIHYEKELPSGPGNFKICLNTTEFIFTPNLKQKLQVLESKHPDIHAFSFRPVNLIDKEADLPILDPIWKNRNWGMINSGKVGEGCGLGSWRYIHNLPSVPYSMGRHDVFHIPKLAIPEFLTLHFKLSPWPNCIDRKLQIKTRIPESDKVAGRGFHHQLDLVGLNEQRDQYLGNSYDLFEDPLYKQYYVDLMLENQLHLI